MPGFHYIVNFCETGTVKIHLQRRTLYGTHIFRKILFSTSCKVIEGNMYTKELSNDEVIEYLPFIQNCMNSIQEKEKPQEIIAEYINDNIPCPKVITASWEVMHRYGVPYGLVRVRCSEPLTAYERDLMRFSVADVNEDGFWSKFQYEEIKCNDKLLHVALYDEYDYFVHTQSLIVSYKT